MVNEQIGNPKVAFFCASVVNVPSFFRFSKFGGTAGHYAHVAKFDTLASNLYLCVSVRYEGNGAIDVADL